MNINVVRVDNPDMVMNMTLTGPIANNTLDYVKSAYSSFTNTIGTMASDLVNRVSQSVNYFTNNEVIDRAKAMLTNAGMINDDRSIYVVDHSNIQNIGYNMRRYMMAEPTLHHLYSNNRCSGWDDQFYDPEPETIPTQRLDYLYATDGLLQHTEDGDGYMTFVSTEEDNPLSVTDRISVQHTWDYAKYLMANEIDPTSLELEEL